MSHTTSRRSVPARPLLLAAGTVALLASASPASAAWPEQLNRADGASGAFPLEKSQSGIGAISNDGRIAYYQFSTNRGPWTSARGVYRRDIDTNKTTPVATGDAVLTGVSSDGAVASFLTAAKLDPADTNGRPDLYGFIGATGKTVLLSRYDGASGAAIGVTSGAYITRGGRYALFGTSIGIGKRDLTTGKTIKVADGALTAGNRSASADGTVFVNADKIVTPTGSVSLPGDAYFGAIVSSSGSFATYTAGANVKRVNVATGAVTTHTADTPFYGAQDIADDGNTAKLFVDIPVAGARADYALVTLNLATGATTPTGLKASGGNRLDAISANAKFGVFSTSASDGSSHRVLWATAAAGSALPGSADDLPSPHAYVDLTPACRNGSFGPTYSPGSVAVNDWRAGVPKPVSVKVDLYTAGGTYVQSIESGTAKTSANTGTTGYKTVTTVKFADGRTATESWTQRGISSADICGTF